MWLFEKRGFVSVVAYDPKKDRNKDSKFSKIAQQSGTHLLVRARVKEDLDMLKSVVPSLYIETDKSADYSFRAVVTRKQFKKFLAKAVDDIDYDSHFKEVARDNSPKAQGRYSAMMSVWSAMAKLQPYSPYGGFSSGSYFSGGSSSYSSGGSYSSGKSSVESASRPGFDTMQEFLDAYGDGEDVGFRNGMGPRSGFETGDEVDGFFGRGVVKSISEGTGSKADLVQVEFTRDGKKTVSTFLSNYLVPADLDVIEGEAEEQYGIDFVYDKVKETQDPAGFNEVELSQLDDEAFEFLTRLQEAQQADTKVSAEKIEDVYDEVMWEYSSDVEKSEWASKSAVPAKYEQQALNLFSHKA